MAAQVLSRELELDCYRIDLSRVISKYIGETEQNLAQRLRRGRGGRRGAFLRRGRRALRQALGGPRRARPLRQPRGRLPAAAHGAVRRRRGAREQPDGRHGRGLPAPLPGRRAFPTPARRANAGGSGQASCRRSSTAPTTSTSRPWPRPSSCPAARSRTACWRPPTSPPGRAHRCVWPTWSRRSGASLASRAA